MTQQALPPEVAYITRTLKAALELMTPDQRSHARGVFENHRANFARAAREDLSAQDIAEVLHAVVDVHIKTLLAETTHPVQCRKGCAHCCHLAIEANPAEATLLAQAVVEGIEVDRARLALQAAHTLDTWDELAPADRACVFLAADRTCRVYADRPAACRKYLVATDPAHCDAVKYPGRDVGIVFEITAEIVASAANSALGVEIFPLGLQRALARIEAGA